MLYSKLQQAVTDYFNALHDLERSARESVASQSISLPERLETTPTSEIAGIATVPNTPTMAPLKDGLMATNIVLNDVRPKRRTAKRKAHTNGQHPQYCVAEDRCCSRRCKRTRLIEDKEKEMSYLEYDDMLCRGHEDERIVKIIADIAEVKRTLGYINQGINKILQHQQTTN